MRIWKKLLSAKRNAFGGIRRALGREPAEETAAIRGEILDGVGSGIAANEKTKGFPFIRVIVRLRPVTELQRRSFEDAFLRDESLKRGSGKDSEISGSRGPTPSRSSWRCGRKQAPGGRRAAPDLRSK